MHELTHPGLGVGSCLSPEAWAWGHGRASRPIAFPSRNLLSLMEATTQKPLTEDGTAFSPVTGDLAPHLLNPEADPPADTDELHTELDRLAGECLDASNVLRSVVQYLGDPAESTVWAVEIRARRAYERLQEAADAVRNDHTSGIGCRMEDVGTALHNVEETLGHVLDTGSVDSPVDQHSGPLYLAFWSLRFARERLDHLVYECELPR